jgi:hypothetical protein
MMRPNKKEIFLRLQPTTMSSSSVVEDCPSRNATMNRPDEAAVEDDDGPQLRCAICMDSIIVDTDGDIDGSDDDGEVTSPHRPDGVVTLACGHRLHAGCFLQYANHHYEEHEENELKCPMCRNVVMRRNGTHGHGHPHSSASSSRNLAHQFVMTMELEPSVAMPLNHTALAAMMADAATSTILSSANAAAGTNRSMPATTTTLNPPNSSMPLSGMLIRPSNASPLAQSYSSSHFTSILGNISSLIAVGVSVSSLYCLVKAIEFIFFILVVISESQKRLSNETA